MNGILNRQVLVLNQNYHPLLVCSARRAISLAYLGKVEVIEKYREMVHSPSVAMPLPSVVKLDRFVRVKESNIVLSRKNILKRDRHQCQYCGRRSVPMTLDHVVPKERGGPDSWENLVCCCHTPSLEKQTRPQRDTALGKSPHRKLFRHDEADDRPSSRE